MLIPGCWVASGSMSGSSLVVMSKGTPYTQQSYKVSDSFPFKWINKKWKEGFYVTSMATSHTRWAVVMSRNAGFVDQVCPHCAPWRCWIAVRYDWECVMAMLLLQDGMSLEPVCCTDLRCISQGFSPLIHACLFLLTTAVGVSRSVLNLISNTLLRASIVGGMLASALLPVLLHPTRAPLCCQCHAAGPWTRRRRHCAPVHSPALM